MQGVDLDAIEYNMEMMKREHQRRSADDFRHQDGWIWPWRTADRKDAGGQGIFMGLGGATLDEAVVLAKRRNQEADPGSRMHLSGSEKGYDRK